MNNSTLALISQSINDRPQSENKINLQPKAKLKELYSKCPLDQNFMLIDDKKERKNSVS